MPADPPPPPTRPQRERCYAARDAFFTCLNAHDILDPIGSQADATKHCARQDAQLGKDCAASWVTYFKQRRVADARKDKMIADLKAEGAQELPVGAGGPTLLGRK